MKIGIIGGSGLYNVSWLEDTEELTVKTPFGEPSGTYLSGSSGGLEIVFLPRHGKGHTISPTEINHRANIFGMKKLGVSHIFSFSAVGSLKEKLAPRDIVLVDQYLDRTKQSTKHSFFGNGVVAHIPFGDPVCPEARSFALKQAKRALESLKKKDPNMSSKVFDGGTYVNMEGPAFSTKAESNLYKSWGMDVIGMTNLAEAKLSREAEICYSTIALVTDYDCWHADHDNVSVDMVIEHMKTNVKVSQQIIKNIVESYNELRRNCKCSSALVNAIITSHDMIPQKVKHELAPLIGKYL